MDENRTLLSVNELSISLGAGVLRHTVIDRLSLTINRGETVALVGESGSGKSMTARAIMGLLPGGVSVSAGSVSLDGEALTSMSPRQMDGIRGRRIGMIFQQPQLMLDPTCRVGQQVSESLRKHSSLSRHVAETRAIQLLRDVGIADPEIRAQSYAFELSGGMAQRVMIASALSADPELLIADEPTTALDVTVQAQILRLLDEQRRKRQMAILLISHDFAVVSAIASRIAVMYAGRIVEQGPTEHILRAPCHPYTRALIDFSLLQTNPSSAQAPIRSSAFSTQTNNRGCRYHPRCDIARTSRHDEACATAEPELQPVSDGASARCWATGDKRP